MAAPTGCFKCGRPGHWSRDCPSSSSPTQEAPSQQGGATASNNNNNSSSSNNYRSSNGSTWKPASSSASSKNGKLPPALPRKRPKLTPDLLLSNNGLGYVLENFPRMVKIQGPGHELEDLKSLLDAYAHWHSCILPYFSFDQFVEKVEKVGGSKRVRVCVNELKDKVARGDERKSTKDDPSLGMRADKDTSLDNTPPAGLEDEPLDNDLPPDIHEDLFDEFYRQAVSESSQSQQLSTPTSEITPQPGASAGVEAAPKCMSEISAPAEESSAVVEAVTKHISEEQKLRMEANRLKALERAKARATVVLGT